jgi:hypothetical protein
MPSITLNSTFATWEQLCEHLKSPAGGSLRIIDAPGRYAIVRYVKETSDFSNPLVPLFRSVVWDKETNLPVCVAPPKAEAGSPPAGATVQISDFVDGVMINGWRPLDGSAPQIATRTSIGARGTFYSEKTFAELFATAVAPAGTTEEFLASVLEPGQFASFVLQHPEHKTVGGVAYPRIFVTSVGSVAAGGAVTIETNSAAWPAALRAYAPQTYAAAEALQAEDAASKILVAEAAKHNHTWQGLVFQEPTSLRRWRLRNSQYVIVRTLRGAEANPQARFVRLRARGQMKAYLQYFKEESKMMWQFEQTLRLRSQELYDAYNAMHKAKAKGMRDLPYCLRPHVYALHGKYLASLQAAPKSILKTDVIAYVNALAEPDQLKLLQGDRIVPAAQTRPVVS